MALKANIRRHVPVTKVQSCAASEYHDCIDHRRLKEPFYTVICYPGGASSYIVDSKTMGKALDKMGACQEPVVVIAHDFTSEALELLDALNAVVFRQRDWFWSDESWAALRGNP